MPASKQWTIRQSKVEGECYYCQKTTRLKEEPLSGNFACKPCYLQVTDTDEVKVRESTVCTICDINFALPSVLENHMKRIHQKA